MNWLDSLLSGEGSSTLTRILSAAAACAVLVYLWISKVRKGKK